MAEITAASPDGSEDVSITIPVAVTVATAGGMVPQPREGDGGNKLDNHLYRFVSCVAFGEWTGHAFGALAFVWATVVLLGGFCSSLSREDFWFATVVIFIETLRIFSRSYKLDSQSLFGTTRALRWINSSFARMLIRPQEGDQVVLIMGLWLNLIDKLEFLNFGISNVRVVSEFIIDMALLIPWSRRPPRGSRQWQMRALAIAYVLLVAYSVANLPVSLVLPVIIEAGAVLLLLNLRPRALAKLTGTPCGRRAIFLAKLISSLWMGAHLILAGLEESVSPPPILLYLFDFHTAFAILVLSLGSFQNHQAYTTGLFVSWTDAIIHICFIFHFVLPLPNFIFSYYFVPGSSSVPCISLLSLVLLLVLLLIGNLQIPAAIAQIVLSSLRLSKLLRDPHMDYNNLSDSSPNMVAAIVVFYVLVLFQGSLYVMASFLSLFYWFPLRWFMRRSKFSGKLGAKAIDLYYERAYATRMDLGMFGASQSSMTFADFAIESISSSCSSRELQVAGLYVLHNILLEQRRDDCSSSTQSIVLRVTSSSGTAVSTLVSMLAWTDMEDDDSYLTVRLLAARLIAELADCLRISGIPGMLKLVSSLLTHAESTDADADAVVEVPNQQGGSGPHQTPTVANGGWRSWVDATCRLWQRMKQDYLSIAKEPTFLLTRQQNSLPVLGMLILEKLVRSLDNCAEILKDNAANNLISKTIGIIGLATSDKESSKDVAEHNALLVCSSLNFLRRLATTGERVGAALRHELWSHPFLLTSLVRILEDNGGSSSSSPRELWEPIMDIIAKLALDKEAGLEIGNIHVITAMLLHEFFGRHEETNMKVVSGEALANLALWGTDNCLAILHEPGYQVINDLTNMLSDVNHNIYVAASLLLNICEHCSVNLSSALTTVMEQMMAAEGKLLELLINLASEISDVNREAFVRELESQTNSGAELVQKLLCTLSSRNVPHPEYPRMRRVIVRIIISIMESCHLTVDKMMEQGMVHQLMESLTRIQRSPSRVEQYRLFYGNIALVLEDGETMSALVARAKALVHRTIQIAESSNRQ